jgi:hypothetical protein
MQVPRRTEKERPITGNEWRCSRRIAVIQFGRCRIFQLPTLLAGFHLESTENIRCVETVAVGNNHNVAIADNACNAVPIHRFSPDDFRRC